MNKMPIFAKRKEQGKQKSKLDKYKGKWVAVKGKGEVVAYGKTIEDIIHYVRVENKTIKDKLPDPRDLPAAMKLPGKKKR